MLGNNLYLHRHYLHDLTLHVRDLICCDQVSLVLGCPITPLRHPLIAFLASTSTWPLSCYGHPFPASLLTQQQLAPLIDITIQQGQVRLLLSGTIPAFPPALALVPLSTSAGSLGILLCTTSQPSALHEGELSLLTDYAPLLAHTVEALLSDICSTDNVPDIVATELPDQDAFLALIAHELRVPLTAIKGYACLLQSYAIPLDQEQQSTISTQERMPVALQRQYLTSIIEQIDQLEVIMSDLLDLTHLQNRHLSLRSSQVNITEACQKAIHIIQSRHNQAGSEGCQITLQTASPHLPVWADPTRLQQVLVNMLDNAIKYSPRGGSIEIQSTPISITPSHSPSHMCLPQVQVTIRDQGMGISPEQQILLFQPFTRIAPSSDHKISGMGLGLYISRKLIEAMGGKLYLYSSPDQGTSVTFILPAASC